MTSRSCAHVRTAVAAPSNALGRAATHRAPTEIGVAHSRHDAQMSDGNLGRRCQQLDPRADTVIASRRRSIGALHQYFLPDDA